MIDKRTDAPASRSPVFVGDLVRRIADFEPDAEALVADDLRITYGDLQSRIESCARALLSAGVERGDRVATLTTPHPDFVVFFIATASIGAIWLGLNPRYRAEELQYVVGDAEPVVLIARTRVGDREYRDEIDAMRASAPSIRTLVTLGEGPEIPGALGLDAFIGQGRDISPEQLAAARSARQRRDACLLVYTSGSTGRPKGALLHHEGIVEFSEAQNRAWPVPKQRLLNYFPVNHVGSVIDVSCPTLAAGGCIVFMEQFEPHAALELMVREKINAWMSVPSTFQLQLALPDFDSYDLSAVELIVWEGAAMPLDTIRKLREICPRLASNYGMTETTSAITIVEPTDDLDTLADTVGIPFDGVEVRLAIDGDKLVDDGEAGEVQARSIYNMLGYFNRPVETSETILPGGWLRTGDLAVKRADGRYRLVGRLTEMFKSGGYNVYPREIENAIEAHASVSTAAVVSRPDELWQEVGVAFVVPSDNISEDALRRHCATLLANYKIPKDFVLCDELPLLPIGKVDKVALRERACG